MTHFPRSKGYRVSEEYGTTGPVVPTVRNLDYFAEIGNPFVTFDQAWTADEQARQARETEAAKHQTTEEQVAIDVTALVCRTEDVDFAGDDGQLAGLYLHLAAAEAPTSSTV